MGKNEKTTLATPLFPNSLETPFIITSPEARKYNCIGWALESDLEWWEPDYENGVWFEDVDNERTIKNVEIVFQKFGFKVCEDETLEKGFLKIAVFSTDEIHFNHVARQLESGNWTSKIGVSFDVEHSLESMENGIYGNVVLFMKKKI